LRKAYHQSLQHRLVQHGAVKSSANVRFAEKTFLSGPNIGASTVPHYLFQGRQSPGHITMFAVALAALTALAVQAAAQGQWNEGKICRLFLGDFPECMLCQTGRSN